MELSIALAPASDCEADGAVCTADGRALSIGAAHIVSGPGPETQTQEQALTASFEGLPEAHDGESAFRVRVAFSEDIGISYTTLRDDAFTVSGGEVTGARRVDGRHDLWEITVEPDSDGDVTITLPAGRECQVSGAICTRGESRRQLRPSTVAAFRILNQSKSTCIVMSLTRNALPTRRSTLLIAWSRWSPTSGTSNTSFSAYGSRAWASTTVCDPGRRPVRRPGPGRFWGAERHRSPHPPPRRGLLVIVQDCRGHLDRARPPSVVLHRQARILSVGLVRACDDSCNNTLCASGG